MRVIVAVCVALVLGLGVEAPAGSAPAPKAQHSAPAPARGPAVPQHPCQLDTEQLCKAVPAGAGRKYYCLEKHKSELHPSCRRFLAGLDQSYAEWAAERHETVAKMLADFYARHEDKSTIHVPARRAPGPNMPAPGAPPNKRPPGAPSPKKPVPASPRGNHESK